MLRSSLGSAPLHLFRSDAPMLHSAPLRSPPHRCSAPLRSPPLRCSAPLRNPPLRCSTPCAAELCSDPPMLHSAPLRNPPLRCSAPLRCATLRSDAPLHLVRQLFRSDAPFRSAAQPSAPMLRCSAAQSSAPRLWSSTPHRCAALRSDAPMLHSAPQLLCWHSVLRCSDAGTPLLSLPVLKLRTAPVLYCPCSAYLFRSSTPLPCSILLHGPCLGETHSARLCL